MNQFKIIGEVVLVRSWRLRAKEIGPFRSFLNTNNPTEHRLSQVIRHGDPTQNAYERTDLAVRSIWVVNRRDCKVQTHLRTDQSAVLIYCELWRLEHESHLVPKKLQLKLRGRTTLCFKGLMLSLVSFDFIT